MKRKEKNPNLDPSICMVVEIFEERGMEKNMLDNMPLRIPKKGLVEHWRVSLTTRNHAIPLKYPSTLANSILIILFF